MDKRFSHIDFVRAVCIVGFIVIHVLSYNLTGPVSNLIWNYLHFVVGGFVFCSGYVLGKYVEAKIKVSDFFKKRILRLARPYYIFIIVYAALLILFPSHFSGIGLGKSISSFIKSLFFFEGGSNFSWLPLLFLELAVLFPLFSKLFKSQKTMLAYIGFALLATLYFSIVTFPYNYYRLVMWIPWSLVFLGGIWFYRREQKKGFEVFSYAIITLFSASLFFVLLQTWQIVHKPLNLIDNKYPPNFYELSYEIFGTALFFLISQFTLLKQEKIKVIYAYLSEKSYSIFFIHIILLDFILQFKIGAFSEFLFVLLGSLIIIWSFEKVRGKTHR